MGCRKHSPGTPCCEECCCIERVEIDFAVPDSGEPGASIGTYGWDVVEEPYLREYFLGSEKVYECTYVAPESNLCQNNFPYNARFPQINRTITGDETRVSLGPTLKREFIGTITWKTNEFIRYMRLIVSKKGTQYKTLITGQIVSEYLAYPTPGGIINTYEPSGYTCPLVSTFTYTASYDTLMCAEIVNDICHGPEVPAFRLLHGFYGTDVYIESDWTDATCGTLPTNISTSTYWWEYYGNNTWLGDAQDCRVPTGSTDNLPQETIPPSICGPNTSKSNTYSSRLKWAAKHTFRVTPCST